MNGPRRGLKYEIRKLKDGQPVPDDGHLYEDTMGRRVFCIRIEWKTARHGRIFYRYKKRLEKARRK